MEDVGLQLLGPPFITNNTKQIQYLTLVDDIALPVENAAYFTRLQGVLLLIVAVNVDIFHRLSSR